MNNGNGRQSGESQPTLIAYRVGWEPELQLVPAAAPRDWMEQFASRNAHRCLPMLIANQAGWHVLNSHDLEVTWNGGGEKNDLELRYVGPPPYPARSHFGQAIVSWTLPYLLRTPPGYNLLARGPANWPRDGASPLEGVVETDWHDGFFAMSWKITRPHVPIRFARGEPICLLVPQRRGELESFVPSLREVDSVPEEAQRYERWLESRRQHLEQRAQLDPDIKYRSWQQHYLRGTTRDGRPTAEHQNHLELRGFEESGA